MNGDIHLMVYENGAHVAGIGKGEKLWIKHYGVRDVDDRPYI